jgi:hypothetical protein
MITPLVFELITMLALCALGFVFGRLWEIRQQTIRQIEAMEASGFKIPTAHLPSL